MLLRPWILALGFMLSLPLYAQDLEVGSAWIRSAPPGVPLAGYMMLHNPSSDTLELVGAEADGFANTMIHTTRMVDGLMKMEHVHSVEIPAGGNAAFEPGGLHLMLMKPDDTPEPGDMVSVTLKFANGSSQSVMFHVKHPDEAMEMDHSGHGGTTQE